MMFFEYWFCYTKQRGTFRHFNSRLFLQTISQCLNRSSYFTAFWALVWENIGHWTSNNEAGQKKTSYETCNSGWWFNLWSSKWESSPNRGEQKIIIWLYNNDIWLKLRAKSWRMACQNPEVFSKQWFGRPIGYAWRQKHGFQWNHSWYV